MIKISNRLKAVGNIVLSNKSNKIIDVGCDHALLDIYLLQNNSDLKIIASDNKEKPLESAKKNILKYSFFEKIEVCLKDGINDLDKDIDTIVISGMGTDNIINILNNKKELKNINRLILSSNNKYPKLRENIVKLGYYINNEKIVFEDNKYYIIIEFIKGEKKYNKKELYFGPILLNNKDELFFNYYKNIKIKLESILEKTNNRKIKEELELLYEEKI